MRRCERSPRGPYVPKDLKMPPERGIEYMGSRIQFHRLKWGLTLDDAAADLGMNRSTLWNIENGGKAYVLIKIIHIAEYYGVPLEELTGTDTGARTKGK